MKQIGRRNAGVLLLFVAATTISLVAQTLTTLVNFDGPNGVGPQLVSLVQGTDGNLYGTTSSGGSISGCDFEGCGTVFKMTAAGGVTTLYSFCVQSGCSDGSTPEAGLILATDGDFYGSTALGGINGYGTIFRITPAGRLTTLHSFKSTDGYRPTGRLIEASDGAFYSTTANGGDDTCNPPFGCGTVFRITSGGVLTTLHVFRGQPDGAGPDAGLTQASDGKLYGTTTSGGVGNYGTIFRLSPLGAVLTVYSFKDSTDAAAPIGGLIQAADGNLYGTTSTGGMFGSGTVFQLDARDQLTTLHFFESSDGGQVDCTLVQATDGNFYGTTDLGGNSGYGTVFKITPAGEFTTLHNFDLTDGANPAAGLFQATNGIFYGTTIQGGQNCLNFNNGCGTVFSISTGLGPFVAFVRTSGKVGQTGGILGQGFSGTTSVSFNGVPANFAVVSDTFLRATVPAGATGGFVTVATPSGALTSNVPFQVTP